MQIAILTINGCNELSSFIAAVILNRMKAKGWLLEPGVNIVVPFGTLENIAIACSCVAYQ